MAYKDLETLLNKELLSEIVDEVVIDYEIKSTEEASNVIKYTFNDTKIDNEPTKRGVLTFDSLFEKCSNWAHRKDLNLTLYKDFAAMNNMEIRKALHDLSYKGIPNITRDNTEIGDTSSSYYEYTLDDAVSTAKELADKKSNELQIDIAKHKAFVECKKQFVELLNEISSDANTKESIIIHLSNGSKKYETQIEEHEKQIEVNKSLLKECYKHYDPLAKRLENRNIIEKQLGVVIEEKI